MRHLRERYLPVAIVSGVAAAVAAGAFGLSAATEEDPNPIVLDGATEPDAPVAPEATGASVPPYDPSVNGTTRTSPVSLVSPVSPVSPDDPAALPSGSPDSPPSAASIDT